MTEQRGKNKRLVLVILVWLLLWSQSNLVSSLLMIERRVQGAQERMRDAVGQDADDMSGCDNAAAVPRAQIE